MEEELSSASKLSSYSQHRPSGVSIYGGTNHAHLDLKARLMELELEKEENQKALDLLKTLRDQERHELRSGLEQARESAVRQAEEVRA